MLKILNFFKPNTEDAKLLTMRERFESAQTEMNAVLEDLSEMPKFTVDVASQRIEFCAPEQFADEALALPAPEPEQTTPEEPDKSEAETVKEPDDRVLA